MIFTHHKNSQDSNYPYYVIITVDTGSDFTKAARMLKYAESENMKNQWLDKSVLSLLVHFRSLEEQTLFRIKFE